MLLPLALSVVGCSLPDAGSVDTAPDLHVEVAVSGHIRDEDPNTVSVYFHAHVERPSAGERIPDAKVRWVTDRGSWTGDWEPKATGSYEAHADGWPTEISVVIDATGAHPRGVEGSASTLTLGPFEPPSFFVADALWLSAPEGTDNRIEWAPAGEDGVEALVYSARWESVGEDDGAEEVPGSAFSESYRYMGVRRARTWEDGAGNTVAVSLNMEWAMEVTSEP